VRLDGESSFPVIEFVDELAARHLAEELARFLGLAIVDSASGTPLRREAATLDQPLTERARRLGLPASVPPPPDGMRLTCAIDDGRLTFTAPREPFDPFLLAYLVAPILFSLTVYICLYHGQLSAGLAPEQSAPVLRGMVLILGLPLVFGLVGLRAAIYTGGSLEVAADGLRVRTRGGSFFGPAFLPVNELDEVRVGKAAAQWRIKLGDWSVRSDPDAEVLELQLIGKQRIVRFGRGRSRAELEWARDIILQALAA
jgi:hypothetical protein